jgi:GMP synthase (glutamine-hydrolysing)
VPSRRRRSAAAATATSRCDLTILEHEADAPAGLLAGWASAHGFTVRTVRLHAGEQPPADSRCDAAIVLGSEQTAYDDTVPWLRAELSFVERLLAGGVPVLGICFGAQVLARVLGARLYRLPEPEIGWVQVDSQHPAIAGGPWLSWHYDAFTLPPGAAELAANRASLQAFSLGPHAGVQFHPEATSPIVSSWLAGSAQPPEHVAAPLFGAGATPAWERASANATGLFTAWLTGGLSGEHGRGPDL